MARLGHWSTIEPFLRAENLPQWVQGEDRTRVAAYDAYDAVYWTAPQSFQIQLRGQEGGPIFIPSGRKIVDTAQRYLAPAMKVIADPAFGSDTERADANLLWTDFARRERVYSKFSANKLDGLRRGDWLFHIFADPERPEGTRISLFPLDPGTYFPEYLDDDDITQLIAVHLVEPALDPDGKPAVRKLSYIKTTGLGGPSPIEVREVICPVDEWGQPRTDMIETVKQMIGDEELPPEIDSIPVYHIPNVYDPTFGWGSSEMRGIERLLTAVNQAITDEELTLVLEGLGVYVTDAGAPLDEQGEEMPWNLGPARVVELPSDKDFKRVNGAGSIAPYQDHLRYLHDQLDEVTGSNDITRGRADVQVAESGIALALRLNPLFTRMVEKELVVSDVVTQMLFDLGKWFGAYESLNMENVRLVPTYGERLPVNKQQTFEQIMRMYAASPVPMVSGAEARRMLVNVGWDFTEEAPLMAQIIGERVEFEVQTADAIAARMTEEVSAEMDPADLNARVGAATALVRAGYDPAEALVLCGLDPIEHGGLLPITLKEPESDAPAPATEDVGGPA